MSDDLTVKAGGGLLNVRVGAIIIKGGRLLMVGNENADYLYSVGGRVQFGETTKEAVEREVFEETGVHMTADRLGFIHENFFTKDCGEEKELCVYELSFYYYMNVPNDFCPVCDSFTEQNEKERLVWITRDEDIHYYPEFFRTERLEPSMGVRHIVTREQNTV